jgi:hypothetical protein
MESKKIIKQIQSIYDRYAIPKNVQRHMFSVAGVAKQICENCSEKIDSTDLIATCLIHDLGNIIKMNFTSEDNIKLLDKEDIQKLDYFKKKQEEFWKKYGKDDNIANELIAKELGANDEIIYLLENKAIEHKPLDFWKDDLSLLILAYADCRVSPHGVVSMQERIDEYVHRNEFHKDKEKMDKSKEFEEFSKLMENELFKKMKIKPEEINEESIKKYTKEW